MGSGWSMKDGKMNDPLADRLMTAGLLLTAMAAAILVTLLIVRPADAGLQSSHVEPMVAAARPVPIERRYGCGRMVVTASADGAMVLVFDARRRLLDVLEVAGPDWSADLRYQDAAKFVTCWRAIS